MEILDARYLFLVDLVARMESGQSIRSIVGEYHRMSSFTSHRGEFERQLWRWIFWRLREGGLRPDLSDAPSRITRSIFALLDRGFDGEPVLEQLRGLRSEVEAAIAREIDLHMQRLPILLLIPLLICIFPAVMLVLIGPLMLKFLSEV